jgi:ribonuclease P protein subunit RPR2
MRRKEDIKKIALLRVRKLFEEADKVFSEDTKLADRYVELARKIGMKANLRMPKELKRKFCKYCYCYLKPGINCRVRISRGKVIYSCFNCKKYIRIPAQEKKGR